jgi:arylsulfatase A-like enzyme
MSPRKPNVVVILSDDHGYGDFSKRSDDPHVCTPHLDRLAAQSVSCTDAYVTAPICSPSRAGLIAGSYQQRWGATWFGTSSFPEQLPSLAERFKEVGYATGYFGKVHYGQEQAGSRGCPDQHGFDESFYALAGNQQGRMNYLRHSQAAVEEYGDEASWRMAVLPMWENGREVEHEGFVTEELGRRAGEFAESHRDQPFFAMVAFNAVHNFTFQLPETELAARGLPRYADWNQNTEPYKDWYDRSIWPDLPHGREYYLAQLELMDQQVGRLLDTLDETGQADNTIVVYLTDNGGSTCNFGDNHPLRGGKYTLWEGGIRVPFLVRWPEGGIGGDVGSGRAFDGLVSAMDLYPSLLSAAGAAREAWQHCDGIDQIPAWRGEQAERRHSALHWDAEFQWAVREGDWKLHVVDDSPHVDELRDHEHAPISAGTRLTNLASDMGEKTDLSDRHPDIVRHLTQRHLAWRTDVGLGTP